MISARVRTFVIALMMAPVLISCGSDGDGGNTPPAGGDQPGTAVSWSEIQGTVICPAGSPACAGDRGFGVTSDGRYSVGGEQRGQLAPAELSLLVAQANPVAAQDLSGEITCPAAGEAAPAFVAEGVTLSLRRTPEEPALVFYEKQVEGRTCFRGTRERAVALEQAFAPLLAKYGLDRGGQVPGETPICTALYAYGVMVEVRNGAGDVIADAVATIRDGSFSETLARIGGAEPATYVGAGERAGTYALSVSAPGYRTYEETGLQVDADECHVIPVRRQIVLENSN